MILGIDILHKLVSENNLVENLCERELKNPEGAGFDLRLGEIYEISGRSFIGEEKRSTADIKLVAKFDPNNKSSFVFAPGKYYLMKTVEKVNTPKDIVILFRPRTSIYRSGVMIFTGSCAPGYSGELIFAITNLGACEVEIEMGARVVHAQFYRVEGSTNLYRGQWKDGRVSTKQSTKDHETQV